MSETRRQKFNRQMRRLIARADRYATMQGTGGRTALRAMIRMLRDIQRRFAAGLRATPRQGTDALTPSHLQAYRAIFDRLLDRLVRRMGGLHTQYVRAAIGYGWEEAVRAATVMALYVRQTLPLRLLRRASAARGILASMRANHADTMLRFRVAMRLQYEGAVRAAVAFRATQHDFIGMVLGRSASRPTRVAGRVRRLVLRAIPDGLFRRQRGRAARIIRTEIARAQNTAGGAVIRGLNRLLPGGMQKKIVATWDRRTANDSKAVHGQIRDVDQPFVDGAGRIYMLPPARPNDREVVIPWRRGWPELDATRPRAQYQNQA